MARRLGAKAEQIEAMKNLGGDPRRAPASFPPDCIGTAPSAPPPAPGAGAESFFTPAEYAALVFAEQMTRGSGHVPDVTFNLLREHFEPAAILELTHVIGLFNYFNRFNNALEVEITR